MHAEYRPYTLIAELTYRCPLQCVYCSNPVDYPRDETELDTATWLRVFRESEALGVVHINLTGGEPLLRQDLEALIAEAAALRLYTNLATSGIPLTHERLARLADAGLRSIQLSIQSLQADRMQQTTGGRWLDHKLRVAEWVKTLKLPLTLNMVLHRGNLSEVGAMIALAERLRADRLELANAQYMGRALLNRDGLLPTKAELDAARTAALGARARLKGRMEILFVLPDYFSEFPKACMDGWGRRYLVVAPDGLALPCHMARSLNGLSFPNVQTMSLEDIWHHSPAFNRFRGQDWMPEPCRSCSRRTLDFGGCRCQAYHLTGDAASTDPACRFAPSHYLIEAVRLRAETGTGRFGKPELRRHEAS